MPIPATRRAAFVAVLASLTAAGLASAATVEVGVSGGRGRVVASGLDCPPGPCATTLADPAEGAIVIDLQAIPEPGYALVGWDGPCTSAINPVCRVRLDSGARSRVVAVFRREDDPLTRPAPVVDPCPLVSPAAVLNALAVRPRVARRVGPARCLFWFGPRSPVAVFLHRGAYEDRLLAAARSGAVVGRPSVGRSAFIARAGAAGWEVVAAAGGTTLVVRAAGPGPAPAPAALVRLARAVATRLSA